MAKLVDLSHEIYTDMPVFERGPVKPRPLVYLQNRSTGKTNQFGSTTVTTTLCILVDHSGTHVDSTNHFDTKGYGAEKIPLDYMLADGVALNFQTKEAGENISPEDLERACKQQNVEIKPGDVVIINTGRWKKWGTQEYVKDAVGVHRDAVKWLLDRGVKVYAIDSFTPDLDAEGGAHMLIKDIPHHVIENITNLDGLPARFKFIGLPLKLRGATGSPIRAIAMVD